MKMQWKYIKPIPAPFVPVNVRLVDGDSLKTALQKLQGQINALKGVG